MLASCDTSEFYQGGHLYTSLQLTDPFPTFSWDINETEKDQMSTVITMYNSD